MQHARLSDFRGDDWPAFSLYTKIAYQVQAAGL